MATYEVNGEQYVALLAGGSSFQLSKRGDSVWAFKVGGKVPQEPAPPEPPLSNRRRRVDRATGVRPRYVNLKTGV